MQQHRTLINPDTERERPATEQEYARLRDQVRAGSRDQVVSGVYEQTGAVKLWDCVDQSWTHPLPWNYVQTYYLRKIILKCSACSFTTAMDSGVQKHVQRVLEQAENHKGAELMMQVSGGEAGHICTGCGNRFALRKSKGQKHLSAMIEEGPKHDKVEEIAMRRFSLEASEPVVLGRKTLRAEGPTASQVDRSAAPKRRRKRSRSRRGAHSVAS